MTQKLSAFYQPLRSVVRQGDWGELERKFRTISGGLERSRQAIENTPFILLDSGWYEATPAATDQITIDTDLSDYLTVGLPVSYIQDGTTYYGAVVSITSTTLTIRGAPMDTSKNLDEVRIGPAHCMEHETFLVPGLYAGGTGTVLASINNEYRDWHTGKAYCIGFQARHKTDDAVTPPKVNFTVGGNRISSNDTTKGITVVNASWTNNPNVEIDTTNYEMAFGDDLEIEVTEVTGAGNAKDLCLAVWYVHGFLPIADILTKADAH